MTLGELYFEPPTAPRHLRFEPRREAAKKREEKRREEKLKEKRSGKEKRREEKTEIRIQGNREGARGLCTGAPYFPDDKDDDDKDAHATGTEKSQHLSPPKGYYGEIETIATLTNPNNSDTK